MELNWTFSESDVLLVKSFVKQYRRSPMVRRRIDRCVYGSHPKPTITQFWKGLVVALLTSQQRSGPTAPVTRFLNRKPFSLKYERCRKASNLELYVRQELRLFGGIRRSDTVARQLDAAMQILDGGGRKTVAEALRGLESHRGFVLERKVARYLAETFPGVGPKQSRNLLQYLGLTRYEIPLDSRITKWLNSNGFPFKLTADGLSDSAYYELVMDGVRELCEAANVYPCVFDAAVFTSFDQ